MKMPSVCKISDKISVTEQDQAPYKACISALDKKVRNLEKRKSKLDGYKDKLNQGEKLDKDQKEAIEKYESVIANLEFARELQKQIQSMSDEADKLAEKAVKKQAKKDKLERQQQESDRLSDVLTLQTLMLSLGTDEVRADLLNGKYGGLTLKEDILTQLDEFYQLISPSTDNATTSFTDQLGTATEHVISYLDRQDKPVVGTTYQALHEVVDSLSRVGFFEVPGVSAAATASQDVEPRSDILVAKAGQQVSDSAFVHDEAASSETSGEMIHTPGSEPVVESTYGTMLMSEVAHVLQRSEDSSTVAAVPTTNWCQSAAPVSNVDPTVSAGTGNHGQLQRPLQDIVSSVQGSYNFLQESEIDMEQSFECVGYNMSPQKHSYTFVNQQYTAQHGATVASHGLNQFVSAAEPAAAMATHPNGGCAPLPHHQQQQETGFVVVGHDPTVGEMQYSYGGNEPTVITPSPAHFVGPNQTIQSKVAVPAARDSQPVRRVGGGDPQDNMMHPKSVPVPRDVNVTGHQGYGMGAGQGRYGMGPGGNRGGTAPGYAARGGATRTGQNQTSGRDGKYH